MPKTEVKEKITGMKTALVVCMDEAIKVNPEFYLVGLGGSAITAEKPTEKFPPEKLELIKKVRGPMFSALKEIASQLGVNLALTSHPGCGWAKAQKLDSQEVVSQTKELASSLGVEYNGHLPVADQPDEEKGGCITRKEADHQHQASGIILTIGGFITQEEKNKLDPNAFVISADWLEEVVNKDKLTEEEALNFLKFQIEIARGIMNDPSLPVFVYKSSRLKTAPSLEEKLLKL